MIALTSESGHTFRYFPRDAAALGYHRAFGFVSEQAAAARRIVRGRRQDGHGGARDEWLCRFDLRAGAPHALAGCAVSALGEGRWRLTTGAGTYVILPAATLPPTPILAATSTFSATSPASLAAGFTALLAALTLYSVGLGDRPHLPLPLPEPKTVVIPEVRVKRPEPAVVPPAKKVAVAAVAKPKDAKATAVRQKLGFLALLGKQELTKAVGGMPTQAERRSPGAGLGGDKGSGGELLTGLGEGVRHTTVGNTGVAGLGGIGKAGAGGGEGGFGKAYVGSGGPGGGRALASIALADNLELEGGLDRAVIQATIAKYLSQVRACYERGLRQVPGLTGQVLIDFEIAATGRLNYAQVKQSSLGQAEVERCIAKVMLTWQFPRPVGGTLVKVNYPFMLKPASYL